MMRSRQRSRGQALLEFALVLPIFALLFFGLIDVGRYVFVVNSANQAAREAARAVSVSGWSAQCPTAANRTACVKEIVTSRFYGSPAPIAAADWTIDCFDINENPRSGLANCQNGDILLVEFHATGFALITPIIAQFMPAPQVEGWAKFGYNG